MVMVVSARGDTTDELLGEAAKISSSPRERELDVLLSVGEQISMALVAMKLNDMGIPALSLCGWQAGVETEDRHSAARIIGIHTRRIRDELSAGNVVVVAGFQGINSQGDITTIGRGGSDTTAAALAAALGADECLIYTDVDGVYSADPRIVPAAERHDSLSYDEMLEMASLGAGVLHNRSVELAKKRDVKLRVLSSASSCGGTEIRPEPMEGSRVSGVMCDMNTSLIEIYGRGIEILPDVLELFSQNNIHWDMLISHGSRLGLTVARDKAKTAMSLLSQQAEKLNISSAGSDCGVAKLSVVGCGLCSDPDIGWRLLKTLKEHDIQIKSIVAAEIKISVLIPSAYGERAVKLIHSEFFGE